jgi:hypothetical protein
MNVLVLTSIIALALAEFTECGPWMADGVLTFASTKIPRASREELLAQWRADLDQVPGRLIKLLVALSILLKSPATGRELARALRDAFAARIPRGTPEQNETRDGDLKFDHRSVEQFLEWVREQNPDDSLQKSVFSWLSGLLDNSDEAPRLDVPLLISEEMPEVRATVMPGAEVGIAYRIDRRQGVLRIFKLSGHLATEL